MTTAGVLLAAGHSHRFGPGDKLLAPLRGQPLVGYAAAALRDLGPDLLIAVARSDAVADALDGFEIVRPPEGQGGQADSLRAGIARARDLGATRAIVVLGDMPFVTADLLRRIADSATAHRPSAATDGTRAMPPACFPAAVFPRLLRLRGDRGAAALLRDLPPEALVPAPASALRDIDLPADLQR